MWKDMRMEKMENSEILAYSRSKGMFWFRIFGYGISFQNLKHKPLTFSERNGYAKKLVKVGTTYIKLLGPIWMVKEAFVAAEAITNGEELKMENLDITHLKPLEK
jgi:hypothetical protein